MTDDDTKPDPIHTDKERKEAKGRIADWLPTAPEKDPPEVTGDLPEGDA